MQHNNDPSKMPFFTSGVRCIVIKSTGSCTVACPLFFSACTYIPTAMEVGLIIQDALNKQVKFKWVWLTLHAHIDLHVDMYLRLLERLRRWSIIIRGHHVSKSFWTCDSPKTVMHTIILLWRSPPLELAWLGVYLASFLVWCDTFSFCTMKGRTVP